VDQKVHAEEEEGDDTVAATRPASATPQDLERRLQMLTELRRKRARVKQEKDHLARKGVGVLEDSVVEEATAMGTEEDGATIRDAEDLHHRCSVGQEGWEVLI
jgi:hypothetical protein